MKRINLLVAASMIALGVSHPAMAQEESGDADQDRIRKLDEVTVTAVKREQDLNDVPVSVTAYTADVRQELAIENLSDFARFTPSLSFSAGDDRVFVRGVGRQTNTNGSDPGVATYSDGIYDSSTSAVAKSDFFIERVEVLRGPQGTLYGRNSIGGAINVISKRPEDTLARDIRFTVGNFGTTSVEASVSGPLGEGVRAKLGGSYQNQDDGYFDNVAGGPSEAGANETTYLEFQLDADVTDSLSVWFKADTTNSTLRNRTTNLGSPYDLFPFPTGYLTPGAAFGYLVPGYTQEGNAVSNPGADDIRKFNVNTPTHSELDDAYGIATVATWSLPTIDIKYLGGYRTYYYDSFRDDDGTSITSYTYPLDAANPLAGELLTGGPNCQWLIENLGPVCSAATIYPSRTFGYIEDRSFWSHELTAQSTNDDGLWWIVGAYAYEEDFHQESHFGNADQPQILAPIAAAPNPDGDYVTALSDLNTESYAVFGQMDYDLTDTVTLTGGLRYSMDEKSGSEAVRVIGYGIVPGLTLGGSGALAPAVDLTAASISFAPAAGVDSSVTIDPATGLASRQLANAWNALSGVAGIQWQPDDQTNYFFRYSRGYKSGGFNAGGISQFPQTDEELLDAFELGVKKGFGSTLQLNATAYHYSYDGLQVPLDVVENGITRTRFFNIADAEAQGLELEARFTPADNVRILMSYAYNDSEVQDACCFIDVADPLGLQPGAQPVGTPDSNGNQPQSLKGEMLPRTVPNKIGVNASYDVPLGDRGDLTLSANYSWQDETYHGIFNRDYTQTPSSSQIDLVGVWTSQSDAFRVVGYVKNLFDEQGYDGATGAVRVLPSGISKTYYLTAPRTFGVQLQMHF
ncbi:MULTISPECIES: TonB-dependent receptor [Hyphomonas]|nr:MULTISPECIES: TonB-dependent receptor [Hyphomonas]MBB38475.1 TonB-dependent receptor [Hyphomonas sp.]MBB40405.1 TonB-dependent receptor [Hyphomonas sp.]|tara:strand:- start:73 stop:2646 length:2574 start_codon:yes stop_codon:yes gene_type:complete